MWGDLTVFDAGAEWRYDATATRSNSRNTPFDGVGMVGRVKATVVRGRVVFQA
jgi:dihydroorotase